MSFFSRILEKGIKKIFFAQSSILFGEDPELIRLASRAGLKIVFIGMESINPKALKSFEKSINLNRLQQDRYIELVNRIRKGGIAFLGAFVLGSDEDNLSSFPFRLWNLLILPTLMSYRSPSQLPFLVPNLGTNATKRKIELLITIFLSAWDNYRLQKWSSCHRKYP